MLCVSLSSLPLRLLLQIADRAEMSEIRLDLLQPDKQDIPVIFSNCGKKMIATCRKGYYSDDERINLLKSAIDAGCGYVDLEIDASFIFLDTLIPYAKAKDCKLILSCHNFETTPDLETLSLTIIEALACGADIVKIATMVNNAQHIAQLLSLYIYHQHLVAFGMGEEGKISRVAALKLGAPFMYVSPDGINPTAPGQIPESEMRMLLQHF